jgi:hypothetical protein
MLKLRAVQSVLQQAAGHTATAAAAAGAAAAERAGGRPALRNCLTKVQVTALASSCQRRSTRIQAGAALTVGRA